MKKEKGLWIAGAIGLVAAIGIFTLKRFLENGDHGAYYNDYHNLFTDNEFEDVHGVEFLAMR